MTRIFSKTLVLSIDSTTFQTVVIFKCANGKLLLLFITGDLQYPKLDLKETRNSYFCVTPKKQALRESTSLFLR